MFIGLILVNLHWMCCSLWDYTTIVMNFLCGSHTLDAGITRNSDWLQYFDVVITGRSISSVRFHKLQHAVLNIVCDKNSLENLMYFPSCG